MKKLKRVLTRFCAAGQRWRAVDAFDPNAHLSAWCWLSAWTRAYEVEFARVQNKMLDQRLSTLRGEKYAQGATRSR